jgi:hypothetical protein
MRAPVLLALALLFPLPVGAQSLGDAAAKENARRKEAEAKQKQKPPTYSNDDLEHPGAPKTKDASPSPVPPPTPFTDPNHAPVSQKDEASWRARAATARAGVKAAQDKVASLEAQSQNLLTKRLLSTDTNEILRLSAEQKVIIDQIEPAKGAVEAARKALQDLEDEARRASVPPGWLEPES